MDIQLTGGCYIPEVIFCDDRLSSTEKLLFGRIFGLSGKEGYCWASNEYLGSSVKLHKDNVSKSITKLSKLGMLKSFVELDDQKRVIKRKLYPLINFEFKHQGGLVKTPVPTDENTGTPTDENTKYSIRDISNNKLVIDTNVSINETKSHRDLVDLVIKSFFDLYGTMPTDKKPRQTAWAFIQNIRSFKQKAQNPKSIEELIAVGVATFARAYPDIRPTSLDTVRRHSKAAMQTKLLKIQQTQYDQQS